MCLCGCSSCKYTKDHSKQVEILKKLVKNGEGNEQTHTVELHNVSNLVTSVNPTSTVNYVSFRSSATEGIKHKSNILIHSSSIFGKNSVLESETEMKRLPDSMTEGSKIEPSNINVMCNSPQPCIEGNIFPPSCVDVNNSSELAKERRLPDSTTEGRKAAPSSINVPCNSPKLHIERNTIQSSCIDVNISSLELSKEGRMNSGSDILIHGSHVTQKSSMVETISERRKRLPASSNFLESDVRPVQRIGAAKCGPKKRTSELHQLIFKGNALQDGAELLYISKGKIILRGKKQGNGILCQCCNDVVSPSKFEKHAGFEQRKQPYRGIYTSSGISLHDLAKSVSNCQKLTSFCTICASGGELVSCSGCAKAFHAECLNLPSIPEADSEWHCHSCKAIFESRITSTVRSPVATKPINSGRKRVVKHPKDGCCTLCEDDAFETGKEFGSKSFIFCGQCEKLYHVGCLKDHGICDLRERPLPWFSWLCSVKCKEVHEGLEHFVLNSPYDIHGSVLSILKKRAEVRGLTSADEAKLRWHLLSGTHKIHNGMLFSKATATFQEAFGPIREKGYDLIPAMVEGRELAKQHYGGMYCAVITKNSEVVSAGLLRVFGQDVAELPLVATAKEFQRKGYFQSLLSIVEQLLIRLKVKFLVLPVDEDTQTIWINKFGFSKMTEERVKQYAEGHWILMFKKTAMLEKALPQFQS